MSSETNIQQVIKALEQQRPLLGDTVVDAAISTLKQQLNEQKISAERKLVTVMFADISGFTALSEKKDPEEVRSLINKCFDNLVPVVIRYSGTIDKFIGDEIMALFGAPVANEKHAELACHCALDLMEALKNFNQQYGLSLGLHIGLNSGLVVAGGIGSEGHQQYSVMGDTVNLGSRLKDKSTNGEIFTGPELYDITSSLFEFEKLTPVHLKGKEEPVQIYSLKGKIKQTGQSRFTTTAPIIGREKELKLIQQSGELLKLKKGTVISIIGEAGIGKSRLLDECKRKINDNINLYEAGAFSHLTQVSYQLVKEMLMNIIPNGTAEDNESLRFGLIGLLQKNQGDSSNPLFPFLASLLGIPLTENENSVIRYLDPATLRQRLQNSFVQFIKTNVSENPAILIWEDLHWSDKETLEVIEKINVVCNNLPLINILSFRPQKNDPIWQLHEKFKTSLNGYQVLELDTLTAEENIMLIQNLGGDDETLAEAAKIIFEKSEGNPFYAEELFKILCEQDYFQKKEKGKTTIRNFVLPNSLQGIVASRIDKLAAEDKWVLLASSVIGKIIDLDILQVLIETGNKTINLDNAVSGLLASDMIRKDDSEQKDKAEYFFKHAITQDVAYNSLLISKRKEIHNLVAEAINNLYGPDHYFITAWHFETGDDIEQAIKFYKKAAHYAKENFAHENELTSYLKAVELSKIFYTKTGTSQWKKELCDLLEQTGDIYNKQTRREEALKQYEEALLITETDDWIRKAGFNRKKALCFEVIHSSSEDIILGYHNTAYELLDKEENRKNKWWTEWLELQMDKCWAYYWQNKLELLQNTLAIMERPLQQYASLIQKVRYQTNKAILEFRLLSYQLNQHTIDLANDIVQLSRRTNDLRMIVNAWLQLGFAYLWANKIEESIDVFESHLDENEKVGDKVFLTRSIIYLIIAYQRSGNIQKTEELVEEYLNSGRYALIPEYVSQAHGNMVWANWKKKNFEALEASHIKCSKHLQVSNSPFRFIYIMPLLAYYNEVNTIEKTIPFLHDLLLPNQRKLEPQLRAAIDKVLNEYEVNKTVPDKESVKTILDLAEQHKYL